MKSIYSIREADPKVFPRECYKSTENYLIQKKVGDDTHTLWGNQFNNYFALEPYALKNPAQRNPTTPVNFYKVAAKEFIANLEGIAEINSIEDYIDGLK